MIMTVGVALAMPPKERKPWVDHSSPPPGLGSEYASQHFSTVGFALLPNSHLEVIHRCESGDFHNGTDGWLVLRFFNGDQLLGTRIQECHTPRKQNGSQNQIKLIKEDLDLSAVISQITAVEYEFIHGTGEGRPNPGLPELPALPKL